MRRAIPSVLLTILGRAVTVMIAVRACTFAAKKGARRSTLLCLLTSRRD